MTSPLRIDVTSPHGGAVQRALEGRRSWLRALWCSVVGHVNVHRPLDGIAEFLMVAHACVRCGRVVLEVRTRC